MVSKSYFNWPWPYWTRIEQELLACQDDGDAIMLLTSYLEKLNDQPQWLEGGEENRSVAEEILHQLQWYQRRRHQSFAFEASTESRAKHGRNIVAICREEYPEIHEIQRERDQKSFLWVQGKDEERFLSRSLNRSLFQDVSRISLTATSDPRKLAYETYRINRDEYLILCKYLSPWFIGEQPEQLANKLFDVSAVFVRWMSPPTPDSSLAFFLDGQIGSNWFYSIHSLVEHPLERSVSRENHDALHRTHRWWVKDYWRQLLTICGDFLTSNVLSADLDSQQREVAFHALFAPILIRSTSMVSENESLGSVIEQRASVIVENGEVMHSRPSSLPLMNQVNGRSSIEI